MSSTCMATLKFTYLVSDIQKVIWLGASGLTLSLMSWAWKGYTSTSKIETFDSNVKKKVHNDGKH